MTEQTSAHGATPWMPGACERCWDDAFLRSLATGEGQVEAYRYLLDIRNPDRAERAKCIAYRRPGDANGG